MEGPYNLSEQSIHIPYQNLTLKERNELFLAAFEEAMRYALPDSILQAQENPNNSWSQQMNPELSVIDQIVQDVEILGQQVEAFRGPCFNLAYRKLREACTKYQIQLDDLNAGDDNIRRKKKSCLVQIEEFAVGLSSKVHTSGDPCKYCS